MPVDPQVAILLEQMKEQGDQHFDEMPLAEVRKFALGFKLFEGPPEPVAKVEDHLIPSPDGELAIGVRVYTPVGPGPFPLMVYFHGGRWTIANVDVGDTPCRALANAAGAVVVSVEYRLGPEHRFPAPLSDCVTATRWTAEHAGELNGDPKRLIVIGDSAGGNLAAAVTLMARDNGGPAIAQQILIYPATDSSCETASCRENADGYMLTLRDIPWFWSNYLNDAADGSNPLVSPLRADSLAGLPPALIITAEYDPLRDEGEAYGCRLEAAGIPVTISRYEGMIRGFLWMGGVVDRTRKFARRNRRRSQSTAGSRGLAIGASRASRRCARTSRRKGHARREPTVDASGAQRLRQLRVAAWTRVRRSASATGSRAAYLPVVERPPASCTVMPPKPSGVFWPTQELMRPRLVVT